MQVKGSLSLTAMSEEAALCAVQLGVKAPEGFNFQTHPKVNKQLYDQSKVRPRHYVSGSELQCYRSCEGGHRSLDQQGLLQPPSFPESHGLMMLLPNTLCCRC